MMVEIFNWSELWSLFIPIGVWIRHREQPGYMLPIIWYLLIAVGINAMCDYIAWYSTAYYNPEVPDWRDSNTILYNSHSLVRFFLFSWFFVRLKFVNKKWILGVQIIFIAGSVLISSFTSESLWNKRSISGVQFTLEALLLLVLCLGYYLKLLAANAPQIASIKSFWVVSGIAMYCVVNFFVFLYYNPLLLSNIPAALKVWRVHNLAFILWNILIAIAFTKKNEVFGEQSNAYSPGSSNYHHH